MTNRALVGLLLVASTLLCACERGDGKPKGSKAKAKGDVVMVQPTPPTTPPLTPYGWGKITVGMTEAEAIKLGGLEAPPQGPIDYRGDCHELITQKQPGLYVMIQQGMVTRVSVTTAPLIVTDRGLRLGASEADVRRTYGAALLVTPHKYEAPPAHYLDVWVLPGKRGMRYETDNLGIVTAIHGGDSSIELVEGCL